MCEGSCRCQAVGSCFDLLDLLGSTSTTFFFLRDYSIDLVASVLVPFSMFCPELLSGFQNSKLIDLSGVSGSDHLRISLLYSFHS